MIRDKKNAMVDAIHNEIYKRRTQNYDDNKSQDTDEEDEEKIDPTKGITLQNDDNTVT